MKHSFDFLVLGSGAAGLSYALQVSEFGSVAIITKKQKAESNTNYAQGGIAAVVDQYDSFEKHIEDTLDAGAGLCKLDSVELIVKEGPVAVGKLLEFGARFTKDDGELHLGKEGGHSHNRIVHAADMTGKEIERVLLKEIAKRPNIHIYEHHYALELITQHHLGKRVTRYDNDTQCFGAYVLNTKSNQVETFLAKVTLLATGGAGQVYRHTTNPEIATGDGIAMAYRAKARVANMEFVQFHPTSLFLPEANSFLISEAVRGHGGILRNHKGEAFMAKYDERKDLAPRDIVARAIDDQIKKSGEDFVYLDVTHLPEHDVIEHFPNIYKTCLKYGLDITKNMIPVVPAAHYLCGGVVTDLDGRTSISALFACGEVACTGVHGANRLASNSLLEAIVFANKAAASAAKMVQSISLNTEIPDWDDSGTTDTKEWIEVSHNKKELQQIMSDYVGIVRSNLRLERAFRRTFLLYEEVESYYQRNKVSVPLCQLRNMISVAYMIIRSAQMRKESRGLHYNVDYPKLNSAELHDTII
ncbi:L-aspartate oxidase [bacterium]|nr:MAG: L-aspartate oxidase [bacterium]